MQHIPAEFAKRYMCTHRSSAMLKHSNKSWMVKLMRLKTKLLFYVGWGQFVADNTLQVGDICRFELIMMSNVYVFNVAIRKANGTYKAHRPKYYLRCFPIFSTLYLFL